MINEITSEGLEKLRELIEKIRLLKGKLDELEKKFCFLIKNKKVLDTDILKKFLENINPDYASEEMLAEYIDYANKLEAFIDELEKCLREHSAELIQSAGNSNTQDKSRGGRK